MEHWLRYGCGLCRLRYTYIKTKAPVYSLHLCKHVLPTVHITLRPWRLSQLSYLWSLGKYALWVMSGDKHLWNVAVCRVHLFSYGLKNVPIIFTHVCLIYQWKHHGVEILFVSLCIAKFHTECSHITMESKQLSNDLSHFKLFFP